MTMHPQEEIKFLIVENARLTAEVERLKKMLWEVNEQCSEHVPLSLLTQIRAVLNKEPRT